ncbi:IS1595 family transposase, partial [Aurantimonas sp. E1-2-R+4]|uniref:IS1595 family transposase n=1 Tax=Aurantimonas sp. E1-2-R+4 TaxID=3113714 RepID=UPI002F92C636
ERRTTKTSGEPFLKRGTGPSNKRAVLSLIERHGSVRSFHVASATKQNVATLVSDNIVHESMLFTDESRLYPAIGETFLAHMTVKHSAGEYVRGGVHTNTVESYFSIFKRGMRGTYQHCAEKHLHRYLAEFDFRHNRRVALGVNDVARADSILDGVVGKRLTYETAQGR